MKHIFPWFLLVLALGAGAILWTLESDLKAHEAQLEQEKASLKEVVGGPPPISATDQAEITRLQQATRELPEIRAEYQQLKQQVQLRTEQLARQKADAERQKVLAANQELARKRQQEIQQQAEAQAQTAQAEAQRNACIANLKQLEGAIQQWALENRKSSDEQPVDEDLFGPSLYIKDKPACPSGGTYQLGKVGGTPSCSIPGHELPSPVNAF